MDGGMKKCRSMVAIAVAETIADSLTNHCRL
jgi:hypothetical protein